MTCTSFVAFTPYSQDDSNLISTIYFFGSFMFLIGRTVAVTLFTSRINDQSKVALPVLYTCPASSYNVEVTINSFAILLNFIQFCFSSWDTCPIISERIKNLKEDIARVISF